MVATQPCQRGRCIDAMSPGSGSLSIRRMRIIAPLILLAGVLSVAGGNYVFTGLAAFALGAWLFDKAPRRGGGDAEAAFVAVLMLLGGLGCLAVVFGLATAPT